MMGDARMSDGAGVPRAGDVLAGKYRIDRVLGEGGMGVVFAARHLGLEKAVAIKLLHPAVAADPIFAARFLQEARSAANLRGEHVVLVTDVDELPDGAPFMVMEHLEGTDLADVLARIGPLPIADAVTYVLQACEAIAEAHANGIVHRDLKPSNLFLTARPSGAPLIKVLDFGIAKVTDASEEAARAQLTVTGASVGSPTYMSPEQIRDPRDVDARTDIWSLGIVLHELMTGRPPFGGSNMVAICARIVTDPPAPLRAHREGAPEELERIVLRCLEKNPADRFANVAELCAALAPFGASEAALSVSRVLEVLARPRAPRSPAPSRHPGFIAARDARSNSGSPATSSFEAAPSVWSQPPTSPRARSVAPPPVIPTSASPALTPARAAGAPSSLPPVVPPQPPPAEGTRSPFAQAVIAALVVTVLIVVAASVRARLSSPPAGHGAAPVLAEVMPPSPPVAADTPAVVAPPLPSVTTAATASPPEPSEKAAAPAARPHATSRDTAATRPPSYARGKSFDLLRNRK